MRRIFFILTSLVMVLAGCQAAVTEVIPTTPPAAGDLPDTWTPAPTVEPSLAPPTSTVGISPSPTPTDLPSTQSLSTAAATQPKSEEIPTATQIDLIPGKELTITQIHMFTKDRGWAIGYQENPDLRILATEDGGRTWWDRTPPASFAELDAISEFETIALFRDEDTAWMIFNNDLTEEDPYTHVMWRTTDGGQSWAHSSPLPFPLKTYYITPGDIFFIDPQQGWLWTHLGFTHMHDISYLFRTSDGGQTWRLVNQPGDSMLEVLVNTELGFANDQDGWMLKDSLGGFEPFVEVTRDGGVSWVSIPLPAPDRDWEAIDSRCLGSDPYFMGAEMGGFLLNCTPHAGEVVYDLENLPSYLCKSGDFGQTWEIQAFPSQVDQLIFLNENVGYALGRIHYRTLDGGESWQKLKEVNWTGQFSFISQEEAWAVARDGDEIALVHTEDGGATYQIILPAAAGD